MVDVSLRSPVPADAAIMFAIQSEPAGAAMAAVPVRDHAEFTAHWQKVSEDPAAIRRIVVVDGAVVGDIVRFVRHEELEIGYRLSQEWWGRGIATEAVRQFLAEFPERPITAGVAEHNPGSMRVLEKCGFAADGTEIEDGVTYRLFRLS